MSEPSIAKHEGRFAGWPTLPPAVGAQMPERVGDIAELDELQERIFDELADLPWPATAHCVSDGDRDVIYQSMRFWFNIPSFHYWPDDRAAEQCAVWRYEIDHGGIA